MGNSKQKQKLNLSDKYNLMLGGYSQENETITATEPISPASPASEPFLISAPDPNKEEEPEVELIPKDSSSEETQKEEVAAAPSASHPLKTDASEAISPKSKRPLAKSKDPNYKQTTVYLPKSLHIQLIAAAMAEGKDVSELFAELGQEWLRSRNLGI